MGTSSLLVLWRKIRRGDIYSIINFLGLSIGISTCLLIFLFVADELSYDRHHEKSDQTWRLLMHNKTNESTLSILPAVATDFLEESLPGVETLGRVFITGREVVFTQDGKPYLESGLSLADSSILEIFSFDFIQGNPSTALSTPNSMILSRDAALRYFGDENPMGKNLVFENMHTFIVTGVVEPFPDQSHFHFSLLGSLESLRSVNPSALDSWSNQAVAVYLTLSNGADPLLLEEQINNILWGANEGFYERVFFRLQHLQDIRLRSSHLDWDNAETGSVMVVRVFSFIALLTLILACFNFVNLSVAMSIKRSKEIGIKKTLGASRPQLIWQFIAETFILALFSLLLALLLAEAVMPLLNNLTGKDLALNLFSNIPLLLFIAVLLIFISLAAGLYPAVIISHFRPISAIKGGVMTGQGGGKRSFTYRLRQLLMLTQFSVSISLIVVSLIIFVQMQFMAGRNPGFEREGLVTIVNPYDDQMESRAIWLKNMLYQHSGVSGVSLTHNPPVRPLNNYAQFGFEAETGRQQIHAGVISCDENFFTVMGTDLIKGRDFSAEMITDLTEAAIINKTMMQRMGKKDPTGINLSGFYDGSTRRIIGVVEDIHFASLHEAVGPMVFYINTASYPHNFFNLLVRYEPGNELSLARYLEEIWEQEVVGWPLQYSFLGDRIMDQYQDERRTLVIVMSFSGIAILLSIMGLVGLALYATATRTREIGIRKVLGARIKTIIYTISREFMVIIVISNLVAWPAAWFFMMRWLENFAYRTDLQWLMFVLPSLLVFALASVVMATISYNAATRNPVNTLRSND